MSVGVITFPGTNCEHDALMASTDLGRGEAKLIQHSERELPADIDLLCIPGGFSYGDYLRCGAMAKISPIMPAVKKYAENGGLVVGICNGFQILCESGLLPGVLLPNRTTRFLSRPATLKVENDSTPLTSHLNKGNLLTVPIAHFEGNYFATEDVLSEIEANNQVLFRYCSRDGEVDETSEVCNPNGSIRSIAGVQNSGGNVFGFMPHPERVLDLPLSGRYPLQGSEFLSNIFASA